MQTIDITPTRNEHARIVAYILSSHLDGNPNQFGDYWNLTELEENALFATFNHLSDTFPTWYDAAKSVKRELILNTYDRVMGELTK